MKKICIAAMTVIGLMFVQAQAAPTIPAICKTCHSIDDNDKAGKLGPKYTDVAAKRTKKDVPMIVAKILNGTAGKENEYPGAQGNMTPNKAMVTEAQATEIVEWILTLKK
jgi:cytochrome c551/c552